MNNKKVKVGGKYMHFKGHVIEVICVAKHTESVEEMVVYKEERDDNPQGKYWVRPLHMFLESVELNGKKVPRFKLVKS